jgi:(2S)-methylsuccinyl-CoA dehydrogenase
LHTGNIYFVFLKAALNHSEHSEVLSSAVSIGPHVPLAKGLLSALRETFDTGVLALAKACAVGGRLQGDLLDERQVVCFDLAWASADLLAAETAIASISGIASKGQSLLDASLSLVFTVEAIAAVIAKLEMLYLELGLDLTTLQSLSGAPAWSKLRLEVLGGSALAATGRSLVKANALAGSGVGYEFGSIHLSESLVMAQTAFRRFAAEVVVPQAERIHRHDLTVPETLLQPMREMGVFGLSIPEKFGGSAPDGQEDALMMVTVTEALSEASLAAAGSLITRPEILSRALLAGGTDEQKSVWLPKIAAGEPLCAIAITEPDFGSDAASVCLAGTRTQGGWLLNGAKAWCTFAGKAGVLMVVTRTNPDKSLGHKGLSLLLVEKPSYDGHEFDFEQSSGGRLVGKAIPTLGYRGMHSFDVSFQNFFVADANVIGGEAGLGQGFYLTMAGMVGGRMQTAARASGVMRAAIRASLQYAQDRKVFGKALADYPLTLAKLAKMAARLAACRQLTYQVAGLVEQGKGRMEASLVKLLACRSAELVTREALQIFGGMGYAEETPVSRYFVDARVLSIFEGAEETLALKVIARSLLESALEKSAD